ncbi:glycine cleavage system protein GcvH [Arhodomonas sp. AD133]|uniref:glycine cleavage system protein GcvH n=1 Tax=Arhodomonas sp. AD133 TaxID=3415009 RepID=UPI003EBF4369
MTTTRFTDDHEWIRLEQDGIAVVGITDHAQNELGDIVHVDLPAVDQSLAQGEEAVVIESVKAAGEVRSPVAGTVVEVNETVADDPAKVNEAPDSDGWLYRMRVDDAEDLDALLDEPGYRQLIGA